MLLPHPQSPTAEAVAQGKLRRAINARMARRGRDQFGLLVPVAHPFFGPEAATGPRNREWRSMQETFRSCSDPAIERQLRRQIWNRAKTLPFPDVCLVVSRELQKKMPSLPVLPWHGDALGKLAVITQSSERVWHRGKQPQMHRAVAEHDGATLKVVLFVPAGFYTPARPEPA